MLEHGSIVTKNCGKESFHVLRTVKGTRRWEKLFFTIPFKFSSPLRFPPSLTFKFFIFKSSLAERIKELKLEWNWRIKNYHNLITHVCLCSKKRRERSEATWKFSSILIEMEKEDLRIFHVEISLLNKRIWEKSENENKVISHQRSCLSDGEKYFLFFSSSSGLTDCKA